MIKRPSSKDTEDDVLKMQEDYLREKDKDPQFQPAAKVVRMNKSVNDGNILRNIYIKPI